MVSEHKLKNTRMNFNKEDAWELRKSWKLLIRLVERKREQTIIIVEITEETNENRGDSAYDTTGVFMRNTLGTPALPSVAFIVGQLIVA